jgi:nucleoside-diphosphate-sugar epimerase
VDVRCIRYPGIISYKTIPGGGTTDYAIHMFHEAIKNKSYTSFLSEDTVLPMMFMDDAIENTIKLMDADGKDLTIRSSYNMAGISFTAGELAREIQKKIPGFTVSYKPDFRQKIADSWPASIDDRVARKDWGLHTNFDLEKMTGYMLEKVNQKLNG